MSAVVSAPKWNGPPDCEVLLQQGSSSEITGDKQVIFHLLDVTEGGNTVPAPQTL